MRKAKGMVLPARKNSMNQTKQEKNKALVLEAFDTLFNKRDPIRARRARPARRSLATCEVLRGLAYSAARAGDHEDLVFDSRHEVLLSIFYFPPSHSMSSLFFSQITRDRSEFSLFIRRWSVSAIYRLGHLRSILRAAQL
jgi:hypothetical protein